MKSKKSFFDLEKNDEHKNFDEDKSNANDESSANENNSFNDMNKNENQIDFAKIFQKKENAITRIVDEKSKNLSQRMTETNFLIFN